MCCLTAHSHTGLERGPQRCYCPAGLLLYGRGADSGRVLRRRVALVAIATCCLGTRALSIYLHVSYVIVLIFACPSSTATPPSPLRCLYHPTLRVLNQLRSPAHGPMMDLSRLPCMRSCYQIPYGALVIGNRPAAAHEASRVTLACCRPPSIALRGRRITLPLVRSGCDLRCGLMSVFLL
eukprot:scaffold3129_cov35-Tisochrysis_lutea.AAC.4